MTSDPFSPPADLAPLANDELDDDELDDDELDDDELDDEELGDDDGNRVTGGIARAALEHLARSIVNDPDSVVIEVSEGRSGLRFSLHVAPEDMGRIIGKRGRVAQAMRTVVRAAAAREGTDATLDIAD
jgi:predicted RNA-binding protein YlqC (UPF0109 family)